MEKYIIVYDSMVCSVGEGRYLNNRVYYADNIDSVVVWLQEHPDAIVSAIGQLLN